MMTMMIVIGSRYWNIWQLESGFAQIAQWLTLMVCSFVRYAYFQSFINAVIVGVDNLDLLECREEIQFLCFWYIYFDCFCYFFLFCRLVRSTRNLGSLSMVFLVHVLHKGLLLLKLSQMF